MWAQKGESLAYFLLVVALSSAGAWVAYTYVPATDKYLGMLKGLVVAYGLFLALLWNLWIKYNAFADHNGLNSGEMRRLSDIVSSKQKKLLRYGIFYVLAIAYFAVAPFFDSAGIAKVVIAIAIFLSVCGPLIFLDMLLDWRDASSFKWKLDQRAGDRRRRGSALDKLHGNENQNHA